MTASRRPGKAMERAPRAWFQPWTWEPSTSRGGGFAGLSLGQAGLFDAFSGAFVLDVADRQPQQLDDGVVVGEVAPVLDDLAELVVQRLDRIGGVDDLAECGWELQERRCSVARRRARPGPWPGTSCPSWSPRGCPAPAPRSLRWGRCRSSSARRRRLCGRRRARTATTPGSGARCTFGRRRSARSPRSPPGSRSGRHSTRSARPSRRGWRAQRTPRPRTSPPRRLGPRCPGRASPRRCRHRPRYGRALLRTWWASRTFTINASR